MCKKKYIKSHTKKAVSLGKESNYVNLNGRLKIKERAGRERERTRKRKNKKERMKEQEKERKIRNKEMGGYATQSILVTA